MSLLVHEHAYRSQVWRDVCGAVGGMRAVLKYVATDETCHAVFLVKPFGFRDDLRMWLNQDNRIDIESRSRVGHFDFFVNRVRVWRVRRLLLRRGLVRKLK